MRLFFIILAVLLFTNVVRAEVLEPNLLSATITREKLYEIRWVETPLNETDPVTYTVVQNMQPIPVYQGNNSFFNALLEDGVNTFGITATSPTSTKTAYGNVTYVKNSIPTAPNFQCFDFFDLSENQAIVNVFFNSTDVNNDSIAYSFLVDGQIFAINFTESQLVITGLAEGNRLFSFCATDGIGLNCTSKTVSIINGTVPVILAISDDFHAMPIYGDTMNVSSNFLVWASNNRSLQVNATFSQGSDVVQASCIRYLQNGTEQRFNCSVVPSYQNDPGNYDAVILVTNGLKTASVRKDNFMIVDYVLSSQVGSPIFDYAQTFDWWVTSSPKMRIINQGNVRFNELATKLPNINCVGYSFGNITVSASENRGNAKDAETMVYFNAGISSGQYGELTFFVYNPDRRTPSGCNARGDVLVSKILG